MLFVPCPRCGAVVELSPESFGPDRDVLGNVMRCDECELSFNYDDVEVQSTVEAPSPK